MLDCIWALVLLCFEKRRYSNENDGAFECFTRVAFKSAEKAVVQRLQADNKLNDLKKN